MRRLASVAAALAVVTSSAVLRAHEADLLQVSIVRSPVQDGASRYVETLRLRVGALMALVPVDRDGDGRVSARELAEAGAAFDAGVWEGMPLETAAGRCDRRATTARADGEWVELSAEFQCDGDGALSQELRVMELLPAGFHVQVSLPDGARLQLRGKQRSWSFNRSGRLAH